MNKPNKFPKMKPIPIRAAEKIAQEYGYDQVIILARRCHTTPQPHGDHVTTYGRNPEHCGVAARIGNAMKRFMGWQDEIGRMAVALYKESLDPQAHNLHIRAWSELSDEEQQVWRDRAERLSKA